MSSFTDKSILVVGGAGFVGSNLVKALLTKGAHSIEVVDSLLSAEKSNLPEDKSVLFSHGSINDKSILDSLSDRFDYIFHLATYHGNQSSIHDPIRDHENNTLTTLNLFNKVHLFTQLQKVVYSSAGCTVAEKTYQDAKPTTEEDPVSLWLDSPYQISKIIGEFYANYYNKQYDFPAVKARFQNVYGPGEILGAGQWRGTPATVWRNVVPTFVYKALSREPLPVEGEGNATRDFIYVDDIVEGLIACAIQGTPGEVYNLASGRETSILTLAETINDLTDNPTPITHLPPRPWDNSGKRFGSPDKASEHLGFVAQTGMNTGLARTVQWTQDNMTLIQASINKHADRLNESR